jgi:hypothetical protein
VEAYIRTLIVNMYVFEEILHMNVLVGPAPADAYTVIKRLNFFLQFCNLQKKAL